MVRGDRTRDLVIYWELGWESTDFSDENGVGGTVVDADVNRSLYRIASFCLE